MNDDSTTALPRAAPGRLHGHAAGLAFELLWFALLALPALATQPDLPSIDETSLWLLAGPFWLMLCMRLLFPQRGFFVATFPLAAFGVLFMGAWAMRNADLFDLALQWRTFTRDEVESALMPYARLATGSTVLVAALCWAAWRCAVPRPRHLRSGVLGLLGALAVSQALPPSAALQVWPIEPVLVTAAVATDSRWLANRLYPEAATANPRDPDASWHASRVTDAPALETVVLILGESVRNDYLHECGGPARVRQVTAGAAVACDVVSGADETSTSIPLLVSREMPGHRVRVSSDGTVLAALREAGYETYWYGVQSRDIAWPDAQHQIIMAGNTPDRMLIAPMSDALQQPAKLKAIVLHAYNAHYPFCDRFDPAQAPYRADCGPLGRRWGDRTRIADMRRSYADAMDASIGFLDDVIAHLRQRTEPVFMLYSPDHGEGLMDDGREIVSHARRPPTRWDTHVPAIFWANDEWRRTHAPQWANLVSQMDKPLMHMDMVPTLLDAAGVRYDEPRTLPVDLLARTVPPRRRTVQEALGQSVDWQLLSDEARAAGAGPSGER